MNEADERRFWARLEAQILLEIEAERALRLYRLVPATIVSEPLDATITHAHIGKREVQIEEVRMGEGGRVEGAYLCPETAQVLLKACIEGKALVCCLN